MRTVSKDALSRDGPYLFLYFSFNNYMVFQVQDFLGQCEDESVFRTSIMVLVNWNVSETDGRFWYQLGKLEGKKKRRRKY